MKLETINRIFEMAEETILRKGIQGLNISGMCIQLGISKKTFYKNFRNKEEFIERIYLKMLKSTYNEVIYVLQTKRPFIVKFELISNEIEKRIPFFNYKALRELKKKYPNITLKIDYFKNNHIIPLLTLLIKKAQHKNIINNFNPKILINVFLATINSIYINEYHFRGNEIKVKEVFKLLLIGVLKKKGIASFNLEVS